jgi:hypothetical protein
MRKIIIVMTFGIVILFMLYQIKSSKAEILKYKKLYIINKISQPTVKVKKDTLNNFIDAIALSESGMRIDIVNKYGMLGKYQFSRSTLNGIGFKNIKSSTFLKDEKLQDKAMIELLKTNNICLNRVIKKFKGKKIKGIRITHSGILAAAHLAGCGNVKRWFRTKGRVTRVDGFGTSIETYLKKFANYKIDIKKL